MISLRGTVLGTLAAWHGLAAFKNLCDLAAAFGIVPAAARWRSHNFAAMEKLLAPLGLPRPLLGMLLGGVVAAETVAAVAFARGDRERAFALAAALFGGFALVDELMADYELDRTHREVLTFLLVAYLATASRNANL